MKRGLLILLIAIVMICGCKKDTGNGEEKTTSPAAITQFDPFRLRCNGGYLMVDMKAEDALGLAGEARSYVEIASCAFEGMDKIYIYNGYEIYINTINDKEVVSKLVLTDDSAMTKEGVYLGSDFATLTEKYGNEYVENDGIYTYSNEDSKMNVGVKNNKIISIEIVIK